MMILSVFCLGWKRTFTASFNWCLTVTLPCVRTQKTMEPSFSLQGRALWGWRINPILQSKWSVEVDVSGFLPSRAGAHPEQWHVPLQSWRRRHPQLWRTYRYACPCQDSFCPCQTYSFLLFSFPSQTSFVFKLSYYWLAWKSLNS